MNLQSLYDHGLTATLHRDRLTITPSSLLTDELRAEIRQHKTALIAALMEQPRRLWLLHFADRESVICSIVPDCNHAEVLTIHPTACAAEPLEYLI